LLYDTESPSSNSLFTSTDDAIIDKLLTATNDHIKIAIADPQAFNNDFVERRQLVINNLFYRSTIESWHPNSLEQLIEAIKVLSKDKSRIDQCWFIFYWIAYNIEYDTVSYFSKNYADQSAEEVFRTKKGICGGYRNLYNHLCGKLGIPCKMISGYSKGYGFDNNENALFEINHGWNIVSIEQHWYLMDSTWGTGYLNEDKAFKRHLDLHYFLSRPDEMIYDHLPENDMWQLLQRPISMTQYMQMPKIYPAFFEFNIELISPRQQAHVALIPGQPYALVLIKAPSNVELSADLKLLNKKVDGGCRVIFDSRRHLYVCYFASNRIGKHDITIFGIFNDSLKKLSKAVIQMPFDVTEMVQNPVSFPTTTKEFDDLNLEVLSPKNTHLIKVDNGTKVAQIIIQAPKDVELIGHLQDTSEKNISNAASIYYDKQEDFWRCYFAPNQDGVFNAHIFARKKSNAHKYSFVVTFQIEAKEISKLPLSYPYMWQLFHDLNLEVLSPKNTHLIKVDNGTKAAQIIIQAPKDVELIGHLQDTSEKNISNAASIYYDKQEGFWRCYFAPNQDGVFNAHIFARKKSNAHKYSFVVTFQIEAKEISKLPLSYPY
jgi:transglutaminase/protease-like cytokinesis protein 3